MVAPDLTSMALGQQTGFDFGNSTDMSWSEVAATYRERAYQELSTQAQAQLWDTKPADHSRSHVDLGAPVIFGIQHEWLILAEAFLALMLLDFAVLSRVRHSFRNSVLLVLFWLVIAALYNVHIWSDFGPEQGFYWFVGYSLEIMLSADNLIVFSLILTSYRMPSCLVHKALFLGLIGCVGLRLFFFQALTHILKHQAKLQVAMGAMLMFSGGQAFLEEDDEDEGEVSKMPLARAILGSRLDDNYYLDGRLINVKNGKYCLTRLSLVIILLEITDIVFAVDSISAKLGAVPNSYMAFSSTVMAVFGLRAAFFVVQHFVSEIKALKYCVAFIVTYIGVSLILAQFRYVPEWSTAAVSCTAFLVCLAYAWLSSVPSTRKGPHYRPTAKGEGY